MGDIVDLVFLGAVLSGIGIWYYRRRREQRLQELKRLAMNSWESSSGGSSSKQQRRKLAQSDGSENDNLIASSSSSSNHDVHIYYGSQTGTAEGFAKEIATLLRKYEIKARVCDFDDFDSHEFLETIGTSSERIRCVIVTATYGEGDPPDNGIKFHDWLLKYAGSLSHVDFSVFGLGNSQYVNFNAEARFINKRLEELGAYRMFSYGEGDDDTGKLEESFADWRDALAPAVRKHILPNAPDLDTMQVDEEPDYKFKCVIVPAPESFGERERQGRFDCRKTHIPAGTRLDLSSKHYYETFPIPLVSKRELRQTPGTDGLGSTLHLEFNLAGTGKKYVTAENFGIAAENDPKLVDRVAKLLGFDLDQWFDLVSDNSLRSDSEENDPTPPLFPTPCTVRTALTCYCTLNAVPPASLLTKLAYFAKDKTERSKLLKLGSRLGKTERQSLIQDPRLNLVEILEMFPSIQPDLANFLEAVPRLQPRLYTIASSSKLHPDTIHLVVTVVRERLPGSKRFFSGVCTSQLVRMKPGDILYGYIKPSSFIIPKDPSIPFVMVGPGTGIAPMRALIQERSYQLANHQTKVGSSVLFFGCRQRDEDFIYQDELLRACQDGTLTTLHTAFSRESSEKVYVQHKIIENGAQIADLILKQNATIFVCGGSSMGKDVGLAIEKILEIHGGMTLSKSRAYVQTLHTSHRYIQELWS